MPVGPIAPAALLRGAATGALTAALSVAAHGSAGGGLPSGSTAALLALLSLTAGALVATMRAVADVKMLIGVLAVGQLLGHVLLSATGHSQHVTATAPVGLMIGSHVAATAVGAVLIAMGGRLCAAVSRVLLAAARSTRLPVAPMSAIAVRSTDQPLQSARLLAASLSHRGPPVGFAN
jgi:hypothetical protein